MLTGEVLNNFISRATKLIPPLLKIYIFFFEKIETLATSQIIKQESMALTVVALAML